MWKNLTKSFNGGKLAAKDLMDLINVLMRNNLPKGVVGSCPGAIHMYMTQFSKLFLLCNSLANQSQISCGAYLGRGKKVYINGPGHITKMADTRIYGKTLQKYSTPEPEVV